METKIIVTPDAYIRAESDRQFAQVVEMAGGVNRLFHFRSPTPLDKHYQEIKLSFQNFISQPERSRRLESK